MIKRFEHFEEKMDYNDLVYMLQDFEDEEVIVDKITWKELYGDRFIDSVSLTADNFTITHKSGFIRITLDVKKGVHNNMTPPLRVFADRLKEFGWKVIQYTFVRPYIIVICKIDDKEMIQKSLKFKLI